MLLTDEQTQILAEITASRRFEQAQVRARKAAGEVVKPGEGYVLTYQRVRDAFAAGVPKRQIGKAYGTSDPGTINRIIVFGVATDKELAELLATNTHAATDTDTNPTTQAGATKLLFEAEIVDTNSRENLDFYPEIARFGLENHTLYKIHADLDENMKGLTALFDVTDGIAVETEALPGNALSRALDLPAASRADAYPLLQAALVNRNLTSTHPSV